jgi:hypothetical protein
VHGKRLDAYLEDGLTPGQIMYALLVGEGAPLGSLINDTLAEPDRLLAEALMQAHLTGKALPDAYWRYSDAADACADGVAGARARRDTHRIDLEKWCNDETVGAERIGVGARRSERVTRRTGQSRAAGPARLDR